jgi:hypothetical protein
MVNQGDIKKRNSSQDVSRACALENHHLWFNNEQHATEIRPNDWTALI